MDHLRQPHRNTSFVWHLYVSIVHDIPLGMRAMNERQMMPHEKKNRRTPNENKTWMTYDGEWNGKKYIKYLGIFAPSI